MSEIGEPRSVRVLISGLTAPDNYYKGKTLWIRNSIVTALGKMKKKEAVPHLMELLEKKDKALYADTLKSLANIVPFESRDAV